MSRKKLGHYITECTANQCVVLPRCLLSLSPAMVYLINFIVWWIAWESQQLWREIQTGNEHKCNEDRSSTRWKHRKNHWSSEFNRLCLGTTFVLFLTRQQNGGGRINIIQDTKHLTGVFLTLKEIFSSSKNNI